MQRLAPIIAPLLTLAACDDGPQATETVCDDDGRCWTHAPGWGDWAQAEEGAGIEEGVEAGNLTPVGGGCYAVDGGGRKCVVYVEGEALLGRPVSELELEPSECGGAGPWEVYEAVVGGEIVNCFGVLDSMAIRLMD